MEQVADSTIFKIVIGSDPHSQIRFTVGQEVKYNDGHKNRVLIIEEIVEDRNAFFHYGSMRYTIYAKNEKGSVFVYREFLGPIAVSLTYSVPL